MVIEIISVKNAKYNAVIFGSLDAKYVKNVNDGKLAAKDANIHCCRCIKTKSKIKNAKVIINFKSILKFYSF
jgi:hypothetical protein